MATRTARPSSPRSIAFMGVLLAAGTVLGPVLVAASPEAAPQHFPLDFRFEIAQPSSAGEHQTARFVARSNHDQIRADLEDFQLVASQYIVRVTLKPPGCSDPSDWHQGSWSLPDYADTLAPLDQEARCDPAGLWTIEIEADTAAFAAGSLRVHVSEL